MRLNRYLASTLFTGLFVTVSFLTPAMGQEQSLQPQGAWAITKIDRSAQGGNSYCTLSRKYDDGVVLSLGRNQTEEYSLAIDFQKPVFQKDKSLKINLQPGPGQIRAYDMMPTSEKAVVVRLGWDTGFFDALNNSQQMKVKIADKNYAFAMPEIAKGQGDLQECMEGLQASAKSAKGEKTASAQTKDVLNADPKASKEFDAGKVDDKSAGGVPAPAMPAAAPVAAAPAQKEQVAEQEKSVLKEFADSIKSSEPSLNDEDSPKRRNFAGNGEVASARKPVKTAEAQKAKAPLPPQEEKEVAKAASAPAQPVASAPSTPAAKMAAMSPAAAFEKDEAQTKAMQKQIDDLKAQNASLAQKKTEPSPEVQKQLAAAQAEKQALQQKLDAARADKAKAPKAEDVAATQAKVQELTAKNSQLEDSLRQAQVRIGETAVNTESKSIRRITELESKLQAAQADNNNLAKQLESVRVQQEDKGLTAVAGDWDLEQATKRYNEAEREIRRLGLQLEQERTSCNREKAEIEQKLFDPAIADKQQIERLSQLEDQVKDAQAKVADTQKMVQDQVNQQVAAQVAQKSQSLEAEKAGLTAQIATLQKSLADRDASISTLQKNASDSQMAAADKARLAQQLADIQKTAAAKDQEIAALKAAPKVDPAVNAQLASLQAQNKAMADAMAAKDKAITDAQTAAKAADAARVAAIAAQPKVDPAVAKQITDLQTAMTSIKADNNALRDQNIVLKQESDKLRLQVTDAATNGGARADQVASLQLQIDTLKRQAQTKDTQLATYQNQLASLQQESTQLKTRLSVSDNQRSDNTEEVGSLTRQIQQLQKQVSDLQADKARAPDRSAMADTYANIHPAAGYEAAAPVAPVQAQPVAAIASTALPTGAAMSGYDKGAIQSLLQKSGLNVNGVSKASTGFAGADNFSWTDSSNVKGLASIKMLGGADFDVMVNQYIAYQKGQCAGDFASMPSPSNGSAAKKMALYEVACVGSNGNNQSASLIFFEDQGRFIAIANQIQAADMDIAMDSRDKIAGFVRRL